MSKKKICKNCVFWNTDREEFSKSNKGWGYCTNQAIRTPKHDTEYFSNNELNSEKDSVVTSDYKGYLTEENNQKQVFGIFQTGENFGCVHFKK